MKLAQEIVIVAAKRTPFGSFGGSLKDFTANDLGVFAAKAALAQAGAPVEDYGHVVCGNVAQTSTDAIYIARHIGLRAGLPVAMPALTVNRLCGSGFQALTTACEQIVTGQAELCLVVGTESMSQSPHIIRGARWGIPLGKGQLEDYLWAGLTDSYTGMPMGMTAEKLATEYAISQEQVDEYSVLSQKRFAAAQVEGRLKEELSPVEIPGKKGQVTLFEKDEYNRPDTNLESLKKLPKVFKKDGVIHAAAASGICDGAAALVVCSRAYADRKGLTPLARVVGWGVAGCDPTVMGIGPAPAARKALAATGLSLGDIDLVEVNEAFAPQYLAVEKELGLDRQKTNVDGGALAVGHPLGASGTRIMGHLVYELRRRRAKRGLGSACIGGGQGIAVIIETV